MVKQNKILIERGRLVVTDRSGGEMLLGAETSKSYPGRIDVHMGSGMIAHMDYTQALAEFKKEGVPVAAFEQAFSRLKKNPSTVCVFVTSDPRHDAEFVRLDKAAQYVHRLIKAGFAPQDIAVEHDGIELDIDTDLGISVNPLKKNSLIRSHDPKTACPSGRHRWAQAGRGSEQRCWWCPARRVLKQGRWVNKPILKSKKMSPNTFQNREFGIFNDEGLLERDFWSREDAEKAAHDRYAEDDAEVHEMCPEGHDEAAQWCSVCTVEDEDLEQNMQNRRLEEQQLLEDGWTTEWEPVHLPENVPAALSSPNTEKEWRALVRYLNERSKREGNNVRYRSIEVEDQRS